MNFLVGVKEKKYTETLRFMNKQSVKQITKKGSDTMVELFNNRGFTLSYNRIHGTL